MAEIPPQPPRRNWLKTVVLVLGAVMLLIILVGFFLPTRWSVSRSVVIEAAPAEIHPHVENFRQWQAWVNWDAASDPSLKIEYEGPESGVGAVYRWQGQKMGRGELTITESNPEKGVWLDEKIESDTRNARGSITYEVVPEGTRVTWLDEGETGGKPVAGYFIPLMNQILGDHFEEGLRRLKGIVEETQ